MEISQARYDFVTTTKNLKFLRIKPCKYLVAKNMYAKFFGKWWSQEEKNKNFVYGKVDER